MNKQNINLDFLNKKIESKSNCLTYVVKLHESNLLYHFDDLVEEIVWGECEDVSEETKRLIQLRTDECFNVLGNESWELMFMWACTLTDPEECELLYNLDK